MDKADLDIVQAINNADPVVFKQLFENYWKRIYHAALQKLPREEDASDITQEVFYVIWKNRGYWKVKTNINAYLHGMLRHKIYDFYAQQDRLPILIPLDDQEEYWHYSFQESEKEDYSHENQLVRAEIDAMPEKMREVFILGRFENLSAAQISEKLGISIQTVRNQISSALQRLRNRFGDKTAWLLFLFFTEL